MAAIYVRDKNYTVPSLADSSYICDAYNPEKIYSKEDIIFHKSAIYKCIENGATGEWDDSKWKITQMGIEITDLINSTPIKDNLADVAFTGDYNDLDNLPTIPSTPSEVGADPAGSAASAESNAKGYTDKEINKVLGNVPSNLNSLEKVASVIGKNDDDIEDIKETLDTKANAATSLDGYGITDAYTKGQVDTELNKKADSSTTLNGYGITDAYTKTEIDVELDKKANLSTTAAGYGITDVYTKNEIDTELEKKENSGSAAAAQKNANDYTDKKIADLINGAPSTLDTLKEIADAMAEDKKVVEALNTAIGTKANKATTLDGYGITDGVTKTELKNHVDNEDVHVSLSEKESWNDKQNALNTGQMKAVNSGITSTKVSQYDGYKTTLDNLPSSYAPTNAEKNVIIGVQKNGTDLTVDANRKVNITVPTKASDIGAMDANIEVLKFENEDENKILELSAEGIVIPSETVEVPVTISKDGIKLEGGAGFDIGTLSGAQINLSKYSVVDRYELNQTPSSIRLYKEDKFYNTESTTFIQPDKIISGGDVLATKSDGTEVSLLSLSDGYLPVNNPVPTGTLSMSTSGTSSKSDLTMTSNQIKIEGSAPGQGWNSTFFGGGMSVSGGTSGMSATYGNGEISLIGNKGRYTNNLRWDKIKITISDQEGTEITANKVQSGGDVISTKDDGTTISLNNIDNNKMDNEDPTGTGSFSLNRSIGKTIGSYSVAIGYNGIASGSYSYAEGYGTKASAMCSHAEGSYTSASGQNSHAEGISTVSSGQYSHAEGSSTVSSGQYSHAEGSNTTALGNYSHAGGFYSVANGSYSFAHGVSVKTNEIDGMTALGSYNKALEDSIFEIGNGDGYGPTKSNAFRVTKDGNIEFPGGIICSDNNGNKFLIKFDVNAGQWTFIPYTGESEDTP